MSQFDFGIYNWILVIRNNEQYLYMNAVIQSEVLILSKSITFISRFSHS